MQSRAARVARGSVAGAFATAVAAVAHGLADGRAPSTLALVAGLVFAAFLGTVATGRRPSLVRLVVVAGGSQLAFHLLFSGLTPGTVSGATHHTTGTLLAPAVAHHGTDPVMWAAHALAFAATVAFLRHAEAALWSLLAAVLSALGVASVPTLATPPRPPRVAAAEVLPRTTERILDSVLSRRGPPVALGA